MSPGELRAPTASVVIPAHNEETVIERCLLSLKSHLCAESPLPVEAIVVANGCRDGTAQRVDSLARRLPRIRLLQLPEGSKHGALNAGDVAASAFPRIYLDADIELSPQALPALIATLSTTHARIASPRVRFKTDHADAVVRSFYRAFATLPYVRDGVVGLGVYGMSRSGRARFDTFPALTADDLFAQRLFAPHERLTVDGEFMVRVPSGLGDLLAVRTRVARGNTELAGEGDDRFVTSTHATLQALLDSVRENPVGTHDVLTYAAVTLAARLRARLPRTQLGQQSGWERDASTR